MVDNNCYFGLATINKYHCKQPRRYNKNITTTMILYMIVVVVVVVVVEVGSVLLY